MGLCPFGQRELWTVWTFLEMSGSSCSASGQPTPSPTPSSCSSLPLRGESLNRTQRTKTKLGCSVHAHDLDLDSADLHACIVRLWIREGVQACAILTPQQRIFLTSHSSATHHQWLYLFSSRHECFTSDVSLTHTRLVSRACSLNLPRVHPGRRITVAQGRGGGGGCQPGIRIT